MAVREMKAEDVPEVEGMMRSLWPGSSPPYDFDKETVFVWEEEEALGGFISAAVRPWVTGSLSEPCPHVEGWYVKPTLRGKGIGKALMEQTEKWAKAQGFSELTSDVETDNEESMRAHEALGFEPTVQTQYLRKKLS